MSFKVAHQNIPSTAAAPAPLSHTLEPIMAPPSCCRCSSPVLRRFLTGSSLVPRRFLTGSSPVPHRFLSGSSPVPHCFLDPVFAARHRGAGAGVQRCPVVSQHAGPVLGPHLQTLRLPEGQPLAPRTSTQGEDTANCSLLLYCRPVDVCWLLLFWILVLKRPGSSHIEC